jgi:hypothetical protein
MKGTPMNINKSISEIKSHAIVRDVEHAFVANLDGQDVLFVKAEGNLPVAYGLPSGFLEKLKASTKPSGLFPLGQALLTPGATEALEAAGQPASEFLSRHEQGDWGEVDDFDQKENGLSIYSRCRILSVFHTSKGVKIWVITESDRSATTLLLPSEY